FRRAAVPASARYSLLRSCLITVLEDPGRPARAGPQVLGVVAAHGHVAELATRFDAFAGAVRPGAAFGVPGGGARAGTLMDSASQDIDHDARRRCGSRRSQWLVQNGAEMVFKLTGLCTVDGPVPGVVGSHGQLVHQQTAIGGLK